APARLVAIPARAGLLAEAAELAEAVGELRVDHVRALGVAALADRPADVVAGEVAHAEWAHREAEFLERLVHLLRRGAFLDQEERLAQVLLHHAVADEAV